MEGKWIVSDHHLAISAGNSIFHPMAEDIYQYLSDDIREGLNPLCPSPDAAISVRFSKIGAPIRFQLWEEKDDNRIFCRFYVLRKGQSYTVDIVEGTIIDQIISDREWFYVTGDIDRYNSIIRDIGITSNGEITLHQYLSIISICLRDKDLDVENNVDLNSKSIADLSLVPQPKDLRASLFKYQETGYSWLYQMMLQKCGCILGDEMGLGKTLQIIAVVTAMIEHGIPHFLIVAPVSLLENWKREFMKFSPEIDVYVHHGFRRTGRYQELNKHSVIIISYNTAVSDLGMLKMIPWSLVVVDEAQNIKNYRSERAKSIKAIPREVSIAVTGTPFENHITDIWSIVDFILPGYLGTIGTFSNVITDDIDGAELIEPLISPILLRRMVSEVAKDLPEKIIVPQALQMSEEEALQYESIRQDIISSSAGKVELAMLQKLRMFCTHPSLCLSTKGIRPDESIKYQRLCEIVENIVSQGEKLIVFTSYKKMFDIFSTDIVSRFSIPVWCINGDTPVEERQKIVDIFNNYSGPAFMALNPRAAGTGLNITGANHVIHYNLEWNPALEDQASARAYRRGQDKTVFVYRLYYTGTVEEIVNQRIENKREIAGTAIVGTDGTTDNMADIIAAINLSPIQ